MQSNYNSYNNNSYGSSNILPPNTPLYQNGHVPTNFQSNNKAQFSCMPANYPQQNQHRPNGNHVNQSLPNHQPNGFQSNISPQMAQLNNNCQSNFPPRNQQPLNGFQSNFPQQNQQPRNAFHPNLSLQNQQPANGFQQNYPPRNQQPPNGFQSNLPLQNQQPPNGFQSNLPLQNQRPPNGFQTNLPQQNQQPTNGFQSNFPPQNQQPPNAFQPNLPPQNQFSLNGMQQNFTPRNQQPPGFQSNLPQQNQLPPNQLQSNYRPPNQSIPNQNQQMMNTIPTQPQLNLPQLNQPNFNQPPHHVNSIAPQQKQVMPPTHNNNMSNQLPHVPHQPFNNQVSQNNHHPMDQNSQPNQTNFGGAQRPHFQPGNQDDRRNGRKAFNGRGNHHNGGNRRERSFDDKGNIDSGDGKENNRDENGKLYCEPCKRDFTTTEGMKNHIKQHRKCEEDGCNFIASSQAIKLHFVQVHQEGKFRIVLETPEDIEKWRKERRRNWPTPANIEAKKEKVIKDREDGIVVQTKEFVYREPGEARGKGGRGRGRDRGVKQNDRSRGRGGRRGNNSRLDNQQEKDIEIASKNSVCETDKDEKHTENNSKENTKKCEKDLTLSHGNNVAKINKTDENSNVTNSFQNEDKSLDNKKCDSTGKNVLTEVDNSFDESCDMVVSSVKGVLPVDIEMEDGEIEEEPEKEKVTSDNKTTKKENGEINTKESHVCDDVTENNEKVIEGECPENIEKPKRNRHKRGKKPPKEDIPPHKRKISLLEMLLADEIRHERNVMLQCIRYIVRNDFLGS